MQSSQNSQHVVGRKVGEVRLGDRVMDFPTYTAMCACDLHTFCSDDDDNSLSVWKAR